MSTYASRNEAIQAEIVAAIEAGVATVAEFDVDAIADAVLGGYDEGYAVREDVDFWTVVAEHAL